MREKVVPIPFLGRDVSAWLYRTTRWVTEHPWKATGIVGLCVAGSIVYEAQVTHKNKMPSPNVKNHLEYQLRPEQPMWRSFFSRAPSAAAENPAEEGSEPHADAAQQQQQQQQKAGSAAPQERELTREEAEQLQARVIAAKRNMDQARRLLLDETDPAKRAELQKIIDRENAIMQAGNDTTMLVRSGQLLVRNPHWDLRNSERNWSILSRDLQQQKDHYWYRLERSKDDDFARNTYSRP